MDIEIAIWHSRVLTCFLEELGWFHDKLGGEYLSSAKARILEWHIKYIEQRRATHPQCTARALP
jgi:hypothetical protein